MKRGKLKELRRERRRSLGVCNAARVDSAIGGGLMTAHPGTRSTQSPHPLFRLKMEIMPSWVPTATFVSLQSGYDRGNGEDGKQCSPFEWYDGQ